MFGQGPEVEAYRAEFAKRIGTRFAAAVSSGTAAVHTALAALRLEPGAEFMPKPFSPKTLIRRVRETLDASRPEALQSTNAQGRPVT